jgi:hypothetical protein
MRAGSAAERLSSL